MESFVFEKEGAPIKYLEFQLGLARREINNLRKQLKSLIFLHQKECNMIKEQLQNWRCVGCRTLDIPETNDTEVHECDQINQPGNDIVKQIGIIHTIFPEKRGTPRQSTICSDATAKLSLNYDVFTNPNHALDGLQEFSHMWILFYFHKNNSTHIKAKISPPRLNGCKTGVFSTRSPHRPSPIGLSLVRIEQIRGNNIYFCGVDMVDGTPVFDIKPYIPRYDNPSSVKFPNPGTTIDLIHTQCMREDTCREYVDTNTSQNNSIAFQGSVHLNSSDCDIEKSMDFEKNSSTNDVLKTIDSKISNSTLALKESEHNIRAKDMMNERGSPDGKEEECCSSISSISQLPLPAEPKNSVRVPAWIDQSPVKTLNVFFKEDALKQLTQLEIMGKKQKSVIKNILREDPRSVYLRERWADHFYIFRISELFVSCKFNDVTHTVTVCEVFQDATRGNDNCSSILH